jgi:hypothetical protein
VLPDHGACSIVLPFFGLVYSHFQRKGGSVFTCVMFVGLALSGFTLPLPEPILALHLSAGHCSFNHSVHLSVKKACLWPLFIFQ